MTNGHLKNGHFMVVATWVMLIIALIGAGFALYGLYGPDSMFRSKQKDFTDLQGAVAKLNEKVNAQGTTLATLQGTVDKQGTAVTTLQGTVSTQNNAIANLTGRMAVSEQGLAALVPPRNYTPSIKNTEPRVFDNTGDWGDWSAARFCPSGQYVCGLRQLVEKDQKKRDDTAMNGIEFYCCPLLH